MSEPQDMIAQRLGDECVWTIGGESSLAGEYRGRETVLELFGRIQELTGGTYRVELVWELDDGLRNVVYYRARGSRPDGRSIDLDQALVCRLADGRWAEVRALPFDQGVFDAFWA